MTDGGYGIPSGDLRRASIILSRALLCLGAIALACVTPIDLPAPEFQRMLVGAGSHGGAGEAPQLASIGRIARITYYAGDDHAAFRERVAQLQSHNLDVLVVVHTFSNDTVSDITELARVPGIAIQILNEADVRGYTGAQYANLMKRVVAAAPHARFVGMGLATISSFTAEYFRAGGPKLDAWAVHAYGVALAPSVAQRVEYVQQQLGGRMPLWLTEMGVDSAGIANAWPRSWKPVDLDTLQAREIVSGLQAAQSLGVTRAYLYQVRSGGDVGFSLFRNDGSERPVVQLLRDWQ